MTQELKLASRRLRRRPARGLATALTMAVGIGAVTAAFAAVEGVLLRDLPIRDQRDLVVAWHDWPARDFVHVPFTPNDYEIVVRGVASLSAVAGVASGGTQPTLVEGSEGPYVLDRALVAGDFFGVLGAVPALGRLLTASDDELGAEPVLVLSHGTWTTRFGGAADVIGATLPHGGLPYTVVGVAPKGFEIPHGADAWATYRGAAMNAGEGHPCCVELDLVGRLRDGMDAAAAAADIAATLRAEPDPELAALYAELRPVVTSLEEHVLGSLRPVLRIAFAAAGLLLLAAVANATLLLLAGGNAAAHDVAIRRALGAERAQVFGRLAADAGLAGILGATGGLALGWLALRGLLPLAPPELPRLDAVALDGRSVAFALLVGLVSTALATGAASFALARANIRALLGSRGGGQAGGGGGVRRVIAGLQVAVTVVTAMGAGLLVRTVVALDRLDPGFDVDGLSVVRLNTPYSWFQVPEAYLTAVEEVVRDLEGRAGILAARPSLAPPFQRGLEAVLRPEGQSEEDAERNPFVVVDAVLPGHFEAMGIPVLRGRDLEQADNAADADPVVVINEAAALALLPGQDAVGKRITGFGDRSTLWTVVDVVSDTRYRDYLDPRPTAYYPVRRMGGAPLSFLLVRTSTAGPASIRGLVSEAFAAVDGNVEVLGEDRVSDVLRGSAARPRFAAGVLLSFAAATLLLAALGVFGVVTMWVDERTREMGVRRALGAQRTRIVGLVLGGILRVSFAGAAVGLLAGSWAVRLLESLLYGVPALDPATLVVVVAITVCVALAAGLAPALRASSTDPAVSLRAE